MNNFSFSSTNELTLFLNDKNFEKILVICGKKSYIASGANKIFDNLLAKKNTKYYFKKFYYPELEELKQIIIYIRKFSPDLIIAVGGGSVLDYAKIANVLTNNENLNQEITNSSYKIKKKFSKLIAVPTTAGSGAEVTSNAVIYINKIKYSVEDEKLKPDYFFLIPELVLKAPLKIKSSSGFDAISQAMESLIAKKSNLQSVNFAKKSLRISLKYYLKFLKNPNKENSSAMCVAANLAGKAISISKTIAPHAVSYPFSRLYKLSHGHAVSLTLDKFLKFNFENIKSANCNFNLKERYNTIFSLTNSQNINQLSKFILNVKKQAKLEDNFKKLGIDIKKSYPKIVSGTNLLRLTNNPVELSKNDIKIILLNKSF